MMALLALIQTAPPPPGGVNPQAPDQILNTALILTQAVDAVAHHISDALQPSILRNVADGDYAFWLFALLCMVLVMKLLWDGGKLWLDAGTAAAEGKGHGLFFHILDTGYLKKLLKGAILLTLGAGSFAYLYMGGKTSGSAPAGFGVTSMVNETAVQNGMDAMSPILEMMDPMAQVDSIANTIKKDSGQLGAWAFTRQAVDATARMQAGNAAAKVWDDNHPNGQADSNSQNSPSGMSPSDLVKWVLDQAFSTVTMGLNQLITYGMSILLLFMNFGLDVMIVRCLMFNAIYLMMAYRIAVFLLPIALVAAWWDQWIGTLRGIVVVMITTTISLNVLADMTAIICSPEQVTSIITMSEDHSTAPAAMERFAKMAYADDPTLAKEAFVAKVQNALGDPTASYVFNTEATFWAPIKFFVIFTMLIMLVGKIGTVISDAMAGSMSYHR